MVASVEERFQAAVNVIKGLPKNGPYQPSTSTMLNFYGLYKQGTEGACNQKKPGFWDIVGRTKWEAWNSNRHLSKEQAMLKYVENLREIIETMSFTPNVQNFVGSISGLDNINLDELDMIAPGMRELAESHPNSPFNSRTNSPQHGHSSNAQFAEQHTTANITPSIPKTEHIKSLVNGFADGDAVAAAVEHHATTESTIVHTPPSSVENYRNPNSTNISNGDCTFANVDQSDDEYCDPVDMNRELTDAIVRNSELLKHVQETVLRMNVDLLAVNERTNSLGRTIQDLYAFVQKTRPVVKRQGYPKWWPFNDISPMWFALLIVWPFVVQRLSNILVSSRRK